MRTDRTTDPVTSIVVGDGLAEKEGEEAEAILAHVTRICSSLQTSNYQIALLQASIRVSNKD